ncbi:MAG: hypothetical protein JSU01_02260 [Bacteroidetes bacterium]|nr:hypothetical protein [Bacteroidota bacterium]
MEPGNPNPNPFDPDQFKPTRDKVKRSHWTVIILILVVLVIGGGWLVIQKAKQAIGWYHNKKHEVIEGNYSEKRFDTTYSQPFNPSIKTAKFILNGGTSIYTLSDTTNQLLHADAMLFHSRYALNGHREGSAYGMDFTMQSKSKTNFGRQSDSVNFKLNPAPVWDISVNSGATELNFDLTKYKVSSLKIAGSAGSFNIKIGQPEAQTTIKVAVGAAEVTINVPKNAACRIEEHSALSSATFDGFDKKNDSSYETPGYAAASRKIVIHFSGGISDFKVSRY